MRKNTHRRSTNRHLRLSWLCVCWMLCGLSAAEAATASAPVLISEATSTRAVALESITFQREPFQLVTPAVINTDRRTRIMVFAMNVEIYEGEGGNSFTAEAEDGAHRLYPLEVEYAGRVPGFEGITQLNIKLHEGMNDVGDVLLRVSLHGMTSNRVRVGIGHTGGGLPDDTGALPTPAPATPPAPLPLTPASYTGPARNADAVRFLEQSTFGPTQTEVARVQALGFMAYLNEQFNAPMSSYPSMPLMPIDSRPVCGNDLACYRDNYTMHPLQTRFFKNAFYKSDQLRQRVAFALHQILVTSGRDMNQTSWMVPYLQILDRNAFGNFRQLLQEVTLNTATGQFLNTVGNQKNNPNENFAREVLQLFSVGPDMLNLDGTPKLDAEGRRIPTYNQETIASFARVFTGWQYAVPPVNPPGTINFIEPMVANESNHDTGAKTLLDGATLPPNQTALQDLNGALDNIFNHPNVGPFIAKRLIRHLVTSNPSGGYVERVASVFNNNCAGFYPERPCAGTRGDLKAVVRAILLDPEARGDVKTEPSYGRLREPALLIANIGRAFNVRGITPQVTIVESDGHLGPQAAEMGQDVLRPLSVFGYFPAEHVIQGTALRGPEFGSLSTSSALKRTNFITQIIYRGYSRTENPDSTTGAFLDINAFMPLAGNPAQLVAALDALLLHGTMTGTMRDSIIEAVAFIPTSDPNHLRNRTLAAMFLVLSSQQYQVQR